MRLWSWPDKILFYSSLPFFHSSCCSATPLEIICRFTFFQQEQAGFLFSALLCACERSACTFPPLWPANGPGYCTKDSLKLCFSCSIQAYTLGWAAGCQQVPGSLGRHVSQSWRLGLWLCVLRLCCQGVHACGCTCWSFRMPSLSFLLCVLSDFVGRRA